MGVFDENRMLVHAREPDGAGTGSALFEIQAQTLVFATGARERYLPFKGWTLPGVMSLGAAQILMKTHHLLPAPSSLIPGSSPLMMVLASELLANGGRVVSLVDENPWTEKIRFLHLFPHHWSKLLEGAFYTAQLFLRQIPMHTGHRIIEACGRNAFHHAVMAKTDADGRPVPGSETRVEAPCLLTGYGFVLPLQAGCKAVHDPGFP